MTRILGCELLVASGCAVGSPFLTLAPTREHFLKRNLTLDSRSLPLSLSSSLSAETGV